MATTKAITPDDAVRLSDALGGVSSIFRALHALAIQHENGVTSDTLSVTAEKLSLQGMRELDACIVRLGGMPCGGGFEPFDEDLSEEADHV